MMREERKVKVAIVDNSIDPEVYSPVDHWSVHFDVDWEAFRVIRGDFPDLDDFSHLVLSGSEASILEREEWVEREIELTQEAIRREMPILGSCYGHQFLALALVGPGYVRRCAEPEVGWTKVHVVQDNDLLGERGEFHVFSSHFDEVVNLGEEFRILASTRKCKIHAFQFKDLPVWGIQAHPEMDISASRQFMQNRIAQGADDSGLYQKALESSPQNSGYIKRITLCFLQSGKNRNIG